MSDPRAPFTRITTPYPADGDEALELLARTVEAEFAPAGWDQNAAFGLIRRLADGRLGWVTIPLPPWLLDDPEHAVAHLAHGLSRPDMRAQAANLLPLSVYGYGMVLEAWSVARAVDDSEDVDPFTHPDRVETRLFVAATVKGQFVGLTHIRGELGTDVDVMAADAPLLEGGLVHDLCQMAALARDAQVARLQ